MSYWKNLKGFCMNQQCRKHLRARDGIFCSNLYHVRGPFSPCFGAWCGECYVEADQRCFPVRKLKDEDGEDLVTGEEGVWFRQARKGDHLMVPFQCEVCHFRNMLGRDPVRGVGTDGELIDYIRRANLDAFWSRASSTVVGNLREAWRGERFADQVGIPLITPVMGPFPLEDALGMKAALAILDRSLDPGLHEDLVQWDTFRTQRSAVTNISQAGVGGLSDVVGAYERNRIWISQVPTHSFWFARFMSGLHKRVGEVRKQDEVVTVDVMWEVERILEGEWRRAQTSPLKRKIAEMGAWFFLGFTLGLRGEEMVQIEMAGTRRGLSGMMETDPYFTIVIAGQTKGNQVSGAKFGIPCVAQMSGSNLQPGKWLVRLCDEKHAAQGREARWLFEQTLSPLRINEFAFDFCRVLREVQAVSVAIDSEVVVDEAYGIGRSLRRGFTAHARNIGVSLDDIRAMNRWRSEARAEGRTPRLDMPDTYTTLKALTPLFLNITRSL